MIKKLKIPNDGELSGRYNKESYNEEWRFAPNDPASYQNLKGKEISLSIEVTEKMGGMMGFVYPEYVFSGNAVFDGKIFKSCSPALILTVPTID